MIHGTRYTAQGPRDISFTLASWIKQRDPGCTAREKCPRCPSLCTVYSDSTPPINRGSREKSTQFILPWTGRTARALPRSAWVCGAYLEGDALVLGWHPSVLGGPVVRAPCQLVKLPAAFFQVGDSVSPIAMLFFLDSRFYQPGNELFQLLSKSH